MWLYVATVYIYKEDIYWQLNSVYLQSVYVCLIPIHTLLPSYYITAQSQPVNGSLIATVTGAGCTIWLITS